MADSASRVPWYRALSRYQWLVLAIAWLGWVFDIMDTALFTLAKGPMLQEMMPGRSTAAAEGLFQTLLLVGWSIGGLVFGVLADRWGRVRTMVVTVLIYCVFTGLTAFCHTPEQVAIVRFITALGIGGEWAAGAALVAEAFPDKARAPGAGLLQSAAAFGPWFAALIQLGLLSSWFKQTVQPVLGVSEWRLLFLVGIVPAIVTIFIRLGVHEPEKWKEARGKARTSPLVELFANPRWRRNVIVAVVLALVGIAAAGNISYWLPNIVKASHPGLGKDDLALQVSYATLVMHLGTLLGVLAMPWVCERFGRRKALLAFVLLSPASVLVVYQSATANPSLLLWLCPIMSFFTIGMSAGFVLYFPELFPTALRATGAGLAYNTSRILAGGVPLLTGWLMGRGGAFQSVAATALVLALGAIALAFAPETRGKGLPQEV